MNVAHYKCSLCGSKDSGTVEELNRKGWRVEHITKHGRVTKLTWCPIHAELAEGTL